MSSGLFCSGMGQATAGIIGVGAGPRPRLLPEGRAVLVGLGQVEVLPPDLEAAFLDSVAQGAAAVSVEAVAVEDFPAAAAAEASAEAAVVAALAAAAVLAEAVAAVASVEAAAAVASVEAAEAALAGAKQVQSNLLERCSSFENCTAFSMGNGGHISAGALI